MLNVVGRDIKFEIVREGRIELDTPGLGDMACGITTLPPLDMATSKLLVSSDRWYDDGAFSRDLIDLAKAIDRVEERTGWLERCMEAMAMDIPKAVLWKYIRRLKKIL